MRSIFQRLPVTALLFWNNATPSTAFVVASSGQVGRASCRAASTTIARPMSSSESSSSDDDGTIFRVLALHGSEGTAESFPSQLEALRMALLSDAHTNKKNTVQLEITAIEAPFSKGNGFAWWNMPPGVRSFTATEYEGFDMSATKVLDAWNAQTFDLVLGHSQGAILIAALIALGRVPYYPAKGYVLNGASFPNPYTAQVGSLTTESSDPPRVLFLMGENDKITPNETGEQLRDGFQNAGLAVSTIKHPGGHGFPGSPDETMKDIVDWILQ
jgi:predicted esterase